jgi:tetratricopeptide (TPR) repeat protein
MVDLRDQLHLSLGDTYTLERELGGGGMSRVFVAEERRFRRRVVVKVLAPELAAALSTERFTREIRLAAGLQQANIVPFLTAGATADGLPWYTMPYVEGESLRERMQRGPVPLGEAVSVLRDVARALAYAHARGVVHRDVKPGNVLLSHGAAVVTDFGIARALSGAWAGAPGGGLATLTDRGAPLGTPAYMAPEQAAGDPADHRADLYAWGVTAYELLAGRHPFPDKVGAQQLMAAHLRDDPRPLDRVAPHVPAPVAALVMQCLAKAPARRPASAAELLERLDAGTMTPVSNPRTLAVATWERTSRPVRFTWGAVVAVGVLVLVGAGFLARGAAEGASTAAGLGLEWVPTPAATPREREPETGADPPARAAVTAGQGTSDPAAYDLYLRARYEMNRGQGSAGAIPLLERALARDSAFAAGWAALATAWALGPGADTRAEAAEVAAMVQRAAARALALDSLAGEPHTALGFALARAGSYDEGEVLLRRGAERSPRSAVARGLLAAVQYWRGHYDDAERSMRAVLDLEPQDGAFITNLASGVARDPRRHDEARALARHAVTADPANRGGLANAARVLAATGAHDESLALLDRLAAAGPLGDDALTTLTADLVALGRRDSAARVLAALDRPGRRPSDLEAVAHAAAALGRWDRAFAAADTIARLRGNLSFLAYGVGPTAWRPAVADPRLRALCAAAPTGCDSVRAVVARTPPLR